MTNNRKNLKEIYFTSHGLADEVSAMVDEISILSNRHPYELNPDKSALLVLDMQDYFLDENSHAWIPSSIPIIPKVISITEASLNRSLPVYLSRHGNNVENSGQMSRWWRDTLTTENPLHAIHSSFIPFMGQASIIDKNQYDAFYGTFMEEYLKIEGIEQVIITGVMTHLCCESTARSAFMKGFEVFFVIDGTATYNRKFHMGSIYNLAHGFTHIVTSNEIMEAIESKP